MQLLINALTLLLLVPQLGIPENNVQRTERAIREGKPSLCKKAKKECSANAFEVTCETAGNEQFLCYRDYVLANNDPSICERVKSEPGGESLRNKCFEQYAVVKMDLNICEKLMERKTANKGNYAYCVETVQNKRGNYQLEDCLKIKNVGLGKTLDTEHFYFASCIAGVAKQNSDETLCARILSDTTKVDFYGDTLLRRCEKQVKQK